METKQLHITLPPLVVVGENTVEDYNNALELIFGKDVEIDWRGPREVEIRLDDNSGHEVYAMDHLR